MPAITATLASRPKARLARMEPIVQGPEDQHGHGDLEDEFTERIAGFRFQETGFGDQPADEDEDEDREDIGEDERHGKTLEYSDPMRLAHKAPSNKCRYAIVA
ncbi:hypothetical protein AXG93_4114s1000 [Marchantia polymorpha subsp. ruderalis]|uniref:Uncharacterized protein n=1 Tax=Marchantia polymorpha subsp. ruderalis TaxID=1480154 RepID=A0A176WH98_MARPO|nr:hypothetical protein AXG93_4114s1000 [Marchantia polymorpha subsp. ruderalis]